MFLTGANTLSDTCAGGYFHANAATCTIAYCHANGGAYGDAYTHCHTISGGSTEYSLYYRPDAEDS
jgi:hypothetical protein